MAHDIATQAVRAPHGGGAVHVGGAGIDDADLVLILLHGRGGSALDMLSLGTSLRTTGVAFVAPQARDQTWYPHSFMAPEESNQPGIDSGHAVIESIIGSLAEGGLSPERIGIIGFSQGACLALSHVARHSRRYALVAAYTGGLIGPPGALFDFDGSLDGTPILLGANDPDPHVPWSRVAESAEVLSSLGAVVDLQRYPGLPHSINEDEIARTRALISDVRAVVR
jgi:predicted esterase